MLKTALLSRADNRSLDMPGLLEVLAHSSARPRYAFMVLNLIAKAAGPNGSAGPLIKNEGAHVTVRDWLCDALTPMGHRDPRRQALQERVRDELEGEGVLPADPAEAKRAIDSEVRSRVRVSGKTNVSRAVSDLVRAGLLFRHYQGYRFSTITIAAANARRSIRFRPLRGVFCKPRRLPRPRGHASSRPHSRSIDERIRQLRRHLRDHRIYRHCHTITMCRPHL